MSSILLIQPPIRDFYLTAKRTVPYGLACIASALERDGFPVEIMDGLASSKSRPIPLPEELGYLEEFYGRPDISPFSLFHGYRHFGYSFEHIGLEAKKSGAFLVGISSLFTAYGGEALKTAEIVKANHPNCRIVLGGHHPTAFPEKTMENSAVDYVLRGEGEVSMPVLARTIRDGGNPASVPGIVFRENGSLRVSPPATMRNPDDFPLPATHLVKQSFYRRGKKGSAVVVASRGCPMKCTYCCLGGSQVKYRRRNVSSVIREIETAIVRDGAGFVDFEDENLTFDKKRFHEMLTEYLARFEKSGVELRAMNGLFPPSLDDRTIGMMKRAGFGTLNLSVGSASPEQNKRFGRPDIADSVDAALGSANKHGLDAVCYIIAGAPGQDPEDSIDDLLYLASRRTIAGVSIFYPAPGSADYSLCEKRKLLPECFSMMRSSAIPISDTTTRTESVTILRLGRILNFMKSLAEREGRIPCEEPFKNVGIDPGDRLEAGKLLLGWFLSDGVVRGVAPDGDIYEHRTSDRLVKRFVEGLRKCNLKPLNR